jgi:hypothetical protein
MTDKRARVWNGTEWVDISSPIGVPNSIAVFQSEPPLTPGDGQIWVDSDTTVALEWPAIGIDQAAIQAQIDIINSDLSSEYLTISDADTTYLTISDADTTYLTISDADTGYAVKSSEEYTMTIALSDEITSITTGAAKVTMRAPFAMTLTQIPRASLSVVSTSGIPTVDINVSGSSILSTKLTIDANEKTSVTAATSAVLSTTSITDDAEITFEVDVAGTGAKGLKVTLYYKKA